MITIQLKRPEIIYFIRFPVSIELHRIFYWWRRRELNPRPKIFPRSIYRLRPLFKSHPDSANGQALPKASEKIFLFHLSFHNQMKPAHLTTPRNRPGPGRL
ncbi:MAG: hypothetical protein AMR96_03370 [Candidatus Adiutrix intracellularis]|nr:MAG: hypothetical protein AMR96_03370 [Candidatus Adiutrix intracellularis]